MAKRVSSARPRRPLKDGPTRGGPARTRVIGPFSILAEKLLIAVAIVGGGALIYLVYGLVTGHITSFPPAAAGAGSAMSKAQRAELLSWIVLATKILSWAAVVGTLLALARYYDSTTTIGATGAVGAFLYFGMPALIATVLQAQYRQANQLTDIMILGAQAGGKVILIVAAVRGAVQVFWSAARRPWRARKRHSPAHVSARMMQRRSVLRACWELARCRSTGSACPAMRERRSCWRRGAGCMCDLHLAESLAQGAEAWAHEETVALHYRAGQVRRPCPTCPIYEEHQDHKFRLFAWLAYPATVGLIAVSLPLLRLGYERGLAHLDRMVAALTFMPLRDQALTPGGVQSMVLSSNVEWVFIGCFGLLLLSYVLQGIEHTVYKWGW